MSKQVINNGESGLVVRGKLENNFTELYKEWVTLTDGAAVTLTSDSKQNPLLKLTSTQSFTGTFSGLVDGAHGGLKLTTGTASAITMTFDPAYTHKSLNTTFTAWTFPALNNQEYFLDFRVDSTTIEWIIGDATTVRPFVKVQRVANQSLATASITAIIWDTQLEDNSDIWAPSPNPERLPVKGTGPKFVLLNVLLIYAANATGFRQAWIYVNGSVVIGQLFDRTAAGASVVTYVSTTFQVNCNGGDYIEVRGNQTSGGALNVTASASMSIFDR